MRRREFAREKLDPEEAKVKLLGEKQPSLDQTRPLHALDVGFHYQLHIHERQFGDRYLTVAARHSISDASSNGLLKKPMAPPAIARLRRLSFG
jgi:hypothetical protein